MLNKKQTVFGLPICSLGGIFYTFGVGMRKVVSLLILIIMLFSLSSCDGMIDFMGKMGGNIMGTDTSGATAAAENATLSSSDIKTVKEDDRITTEDGKTELKLGSITVEVNMEGIDSILPPIGETVVSDIANAIRNDESTKVLVEQMGKEVTDESVKTAAKGTAQVMNSILSDYKNSITEAVGNEGDLATAVSEALSSIENSLKEITKEGATITAGDVVTLQLVESFATDVASVVDKEGNIDKDKVSSLISSANTLATVTSSLSSATKFSLDLESIISSVMDALPEEDERGMMLSLPVEGSEEKPQIIKDIESYDLTAYTTAIRSVFKSISNVVGNSEASFERNVIGLGLHKATYETYVNIVYPFIDSLRGSDKIAYDSFKSFDGLFKYVVASLLSELDRYYDILVNDKTVYDNLVSISPELGALDLKDHNIWFIIEECVKAEGNRWITDSSIKLDKYTFDVPDEYEALVVSVIEAFNDEENAGESQILGDKVVEIFQDPRCRIPMVSALYTIDKMVDIVNLSSITNLAGDVDFHAMIGDALEFFGVEAE